MSTSKSAPKHQTLAKGHKPEAKRNSSPVIESSPVLDEAVQVAAPESVADAARQKMVAEAAYFRAEQRGFESGHELEDWLAAEAEMIGCSPHEVSEGSLQ